MAAAQEFDYGGVDAVVVAVGVGERFPGQGRHQQHRTPATLPVSQPAPVGATAFLRFPVSKNSEFAGTRSGDTLAVCILERVSDHGDD